MDFVERREFRRIVDNLPLILITKKDPLNKLSAVALNISGGSMLFQTEAVLSVGEWVELHASTVSQTMRVRAVIERKDQNIYGCRFVEVDDAFIKRFQYLLLTRYEM
jgi:hypothetical protein